jgi:hypothetical protein
MPIKVDDTTLSSVCFRIGSEMANEINPSPEISNVAIATQFAHTIYAILEMRNGIDCCRSMPPGGQKMKKKNIYYEIFNG